MIIVTVKSKIKPDYKDLYIKEYKTVAPIVKAEEGCLEYELYHKDPIRFEFFLFERWESREKLDAHLKTKHMVVFIEKTSDWFNSKEIKIYEVQ